MTDEDAGGLAPQLSVRRWTADEDGEPVVSDEGWVFEGDGMRRSTKGGAAVALGSAIAPRTEDITCIWIEDVDVVSPDELVAALPRERQYLAGACEIVGSDVELPWELVGDTSRTVVVIDDERWAPFPLGDEDVVWLRCDRDQLECARIEPALTSSWSEPAGSSSGR